MDKVTATMIKKQQIQFEHPIQQILSQLSNSLHLLNDQQYTLSIEKLFNSTIGQHVRHIIEFFTCLEKGYHTGIVNYEKRERDLRIETDKQHARILMHNISASIDRPDKNLLLEANYDETSNTTLTLHTNYYREVVYNLEHTIHHMALIRIGINELSEIQLPADFGVAPSTVKYKKFINISQKESPH